jgi:lipopolysaccharide/colanic/teichoic acid biosynthesis glycosyltransferase
MVAFRAAEPLDVEVLPAPTVVQVLPAHSAADLAPAKTALTPARSAGLADTARIEQLPERFIEIIPFRFRRERPLERGLKRAIDVVGASVGLVLLSPLLLVTALALRIVGGPPVLFRQPRVGLGGRPFTIVKFRTMSHDAEERYAELAALSDTRGAAFKMTNDPRITRLGRILRKTSIDELPQLWNVLRGEMSLVGPRPAPPREVVLYEAWHLQRLTVKPGITGAWQISARLDDDFDRRAALDVDYVERWSLMLDIRILLATIPALIRQPGR